MTGIAETRKKMVDEYRSRHSDQFEFYDKKAAKYKRIFHWSSLTIIILGAFTAFIPTLGLDGPAEPIGLTETILAGIGAIIVVLKGAERIWLPDEKWITYRKSAESLRRESHDFIENQPPFKELSEDDAFSLFVERCSRVLVEEHTKFGGTE